MISEFCLDVNSVSIQIGQDLDSSDIRICLPYMNVQVEIGDEMPLVWPPDYILNPKDGSIILNPKTGQPLINANRH